MSLKRLATRVSFVIVGLLITAMPIQTLALARNMSSTAVLPPAFDNRLDPVYVLDSYYNAINLKDYARAYDYWQREPNGRTLAQFTQGFSDTVSVEAFVRLPYFVGVAAGSLYASLPTMVIAQRTNGLRQAYIGCFMTQRANVPVGNATEPDPNWSLYDASLRAVQSADVSLLDTACELSTTLAMEQAYEDALDPLHLLVSYFNAIIRQDYARAYGYWETPFQTYTQFAQGFTQTAEVGLVVRLAIQMEGAAGSIYTAIPALVTAKLRDGTGQVFAGCYVMRRSNVPVGNATQPDPRWRLYDTKVKQAATLNAGLALALGACQ